jgi:hypothetical protein
MKRIPTVSALVVFTYYSVRSYSAISKRGRGWHVRVVK